MTYVDPKRREFSALVTAIWSPPSHDLKEGDSPSLNVVYVSPDENEHDTYGRQVKRETSIPHQTQQMAPGNYWKL